MLNLSADRRLERRSAKISRKSTDLEYNEKLSIGRRSVLKIGLALTKNNRSVGYDADAMGQIDEGRERRRLAELYAGMEKGELEEIAKDPGSLTPVAREALRTEMLSRGMEAPPARAEATETSASKDGAPSPVVIARYGGVPEAMLAKSMLDSAGIESFLGDENLVRLDWFYSNLVGGIKLMVREEDAETARALLENNSPEKP